MLLKISLGLFVLLSVSGIAAGAADLVGATPLEYFTDYLKAGNGYNDTAMEVIMVLRRMIGSWLISTGLTALILIPIARKSKVAFLAMSSLFVLPNLMYLIFTTSPIGFGIPGQVSLSVVILALLATALGYSQVKKAE
jgi:hypothetical protein